MRSNLFLLVVALSLACTPKTKIITTNIVDPNSLTGISQFRSCCGHDYSGGGETGRSMKHYLYPKSSFGATNDTLALYAPFDGEIVKIAPEDHRLGCWGNIVQGYQIDIVPYARPDIKLKIFHSFPSVTKGPVTSGQQIGYADLRNCNDSTGLPTQGSFDVSVEGGGKKYSYFEWLDAGPLNAWIARGGVTSRDMPIISQQFRDANPCADYQNTSCTAGTISLPQF